MNSQKKIAILGGGPAGLMLAYQLQKRSDLTAKIFLIEKEKNVGGIAGGFEFYGLHFDYGSHRLHLQTNPDILNEIVKLLEDDLLDRTRNGRIRILGRYIRFPLNPADLLLRLPPSFVFGFILDMCTKPFRRIKSDQHSFASALLKGLGKTICDKFYFPYAQKLWGLPPEKLSEVQAQKRVAAGSFGKILTKVFSRFFNGKNNMANRYYYPRYGFYEIFQKMANKVQIMGVDVFLNEPVTGLKKTHSGYAINTKTRQFDADFVFSTIPVTELASMLSDAPANAIEHLNHRCMVFFYLILKKSQFTSYDAHYFPEMELCFARMAEMSNYTDLPRKDITGLCFELPCNNDDTIWNATEEQLKNWIIEDLHKIDLPVQNNEIISVRAERKEYIYPVYDLSFQTCFHELDEFIHRQPDLIILGRQGLFVHDNTHHAMEMSVGASQCLNPDLTWHQDLWMSYRKKFNQNVVVD